MCLGELPAILGRRATCQGSTPRHSRHHRHRVCAVCRHQARTLNFALDRVRGVSGKFEAAGGGAQLGFSPRILRSTGHVVGQSTGSISHSQTRSTSVITPSSRKVP